MEVGAARATRARRHLRAALDLDWAEIVARRCRMGDGRRAKGRAVAAGRQLTGRDLDARPAARASRARRRALRRGRSHPTRRLSMAPEGSAEVVIQMYYNYSSSSLCL